MHCLVPGLFRSLKRGERKKLKLDVTYHYAEMNKHGSSASSLLALMTCGCCKVLWLLEDRGHHPDARANSGLAEATPSIP